MESDKWLSLLIVFALACVILCTIGVASISSENQEGEKTVTASGALSATLTSESGGKRLTVTAERNHAVIITIDKSELTSVSNATVKSVSISSGFTKLKADWTVPYATKIQIATSRLIDTAGTYTYFSSSSEDYVTVTLGMGGDYTSTVKIFITYIVVNSTAMSVNTGDGFVTGNAVLHDGTEWRTPKAIYVHDGTGWKLSK